MPVDDSPPDNSLPTNGTKTRLERVEAQVDRVEKKVDDQGKRIDRLFTFLTGEGVPGDIGKMGQIAQTMTDISTALATISANQEAEIKDQVKKEVTEQLKDARWSAVKISARGLWLFAGFLVAVGSLVVAIIALSSHGAIIPK